MMFQELSLFPWLTAIENVAWPLEMKGLPKRERLPKAAEYLDLVHLSRFADLYPGQLSGGMKQRVALARLFALDPEIMLMDEPFAEVLEQSSRRGSITLPKLRIAFRVMRKTRPVVGALRRRRSLLSHNERKGRQNWPPDPGFIDGISKNTLMQLSRAYEAEVPSASRSLAARLIYSTRSAPTALKRNSRAPQQANERAGKNLVLDDDGLRCEHNDWTLSRSRLAKNGLLIGRRRVCVICDWHRPFISSSEQSSGPPPSRLGQTLVPAIRIHRLVLLKLFAPRRARASNLHGSRCKNANGHNPGLLAP
jgi:ABC transporter